MQSASVDSQHSSGLFYAPTQLRYCILRRYASLVYGVGVCECGAVERQVLHISRVHLLHGTRACCCLFIGAAAAGDLHVDGGRAHRRVSPPPACN